MFVHPSSRSYANSQWHHGSMPRACDGMQSTDCQPSCMKFMTPRCFSCQKIIEGWRVAAILRKQSQGWRWDLVLTILTREFGSGRTELIRGEIANQPRAHHLGGRVSLVSLTTRCAPAAGAGLLCSQHLVKRGMLPFVCSFRLLIHLDPALS